MSSVKQVLEETSPHAGGTKTWGQRAPVLQGSTCAKSGVFAVLGPLDIVLDTPHMGKNINRQV